MKHFLAAISLFFLFAAYCAAQDDYEPTTSWPYIYEDFSQGTIHYNVGNDRSGLFNICIAGNKLHYIDGGKVKEVNSSEVFSVKIGNDFYQNAGGSLLKVVAKSDKALVVNEKEIDMAQLNETGGAYGSSSVTTGTTALSSLEGIGGTRSNMNHMELRANKQNGKTLPLVSKNYMFVKGWKIACTKKDFLEAPGLDQPKAKAFLKENKIKWNDPQSALVAADFLSNEIQ